MKTLRLGLVVAFGVALLFVTAVCVSAQNPPQPPAETHQSCESCNAHGLSGTWRGYKHLGNGRWDNPTPEPPLTAWAKAHLLYKAISHDALTGVLANPNIKPYPGVPDGKRDFYKTDQYGVPANDPNGEYPGKDCEPLSVPAMYDYPNLGSMSIVPAPEGDRIYQMFEYHREWRTWWLRDQHPKNTTPNYEGNSIAHWEGNALVVDTIGFNGKTMISGIIGHRKSSAFRLVERFHLIDPNHLEIDMTYYDPKAWGNKAWTGFHKFYERTSDTNFREFICSPREYLEYNERLGTGLNK